MILTKKNKTIPETVFFKGIAKVKLRKTDRIGNKSLEISLEFPFLKKREFKKVILKDEYFVDKFISNPGDPTNSILNIISERLGFGLQSTKFQEAISYYQAGLNPLAKIPFTLFRKGERWIDELTTLLDSVSGYIFVNQEFKLVYNSYADLKFKNSVKEFHRNEIYKMIPYRINPGTNNGVRLEFDRFEMEEEVSDVFKADKKVYAKIGEKFNLKLKYISDIVLEPTVKSCEVYYYNGETPVIISDYSKYVKFDLNGNNGELLINNTYSKDIYVDKVVIEGKPLLKYPDNSTILKNKTVTEELQEDFLNLGKNKYIQSFYMSRSKAVESYYSKVKDTESLEIIVEFSPQYELGNKVEFEGIYYCIDRINHTFDSRNGYNTKLSLIPVLNPDFLNIIWKETETLNKFKPSIDLDMANGLIGEKIEQSSKDVLESANGFTKEIKQRLENQLAEDVKSLEELVGEYRREQSAEIKTEADRITQEVKDRKEAITATEKKVETLNSKIETTAEGILQEVSKANTTIKDLGLEVSEAKTSIKQTSDNLTLTAEKVTSNDALLNSGVHLISKINIAPEGISIDAKKVSIGNGTVTVEEAVKGIGEGRVTINANTVFNGEAIVKSVGINETTEIKGGSITFTRNNEPLTTIRNMEMKEIYVEASAPTRVVFDKFELPMKVLPSIKSLDFSHDSVVEVFCEANYVERSNPPAFDFRLGGRTVSTTVPPPIEVHLKSFTFGNCVETELKRAKMEAIGLVATNYQDSNNGSWPSPPTFISVPTFALIIERNDNGNWNQIYNEENIKMSCSVTSNGSREGLRVRAGVDPVSIERALSIYKQYATPANSGYRMMISITNANATLSAGGYGTTWETGGTENGISHQYITRINQKTIFTLKESDFAGYLFEYTTTNQTIRPNFGKGWIQYVAMEYKE